MDTSSVVARAHIPQDQAALLKLGDKATITVPGAGSEEAEPIGRESDRRQPGFLIPIARPVEVWVKADNPKGRLATRNEREDFHAGAFSA